MCGGIGGVVAVTSAWGLVADERVQVILRGRAGPQGLRSQDPP